MRCGKEDGRKEQKGWRRNEVVSRRRIVYSVGGKKEKSKEMEKGGRREGEGREKGGRREGEG